MKITLPKKKRYLLRIIAPAYPAFNIYSFVADKTTAVGPLYVATSAKEVSGWDVEVIDENNLRRFGPKDPYRGADHNVLQQRRKADVVGFYGGLTSTIPRLYELARFYKSQGAITIAGGQHFVEETIPEGLDSGLDCIVRGEGEEAIKELLEAFTSDGNISDILGIAYRDHSSVIHTHSRPPIQNLDDIPSPDFSLLRYANLYLYPINRVRGCGMDCEFCAVKGRARFSSAEKIIEQISKLVETFSAKEFFVVDDLFGQDRNETILFCRMYKEYQERIGKKLMMSVQIRLDKARDTEMLTAMREANIHAVCIGVETPIPQELKAMRKHLKPEDMIELARIFHYFGFFVHRMLIFGYPMKEGVIFDMPVKERVKYFKDFIRKSRIDTIQVLLPVPLPGTELRARLHKQNRIFPKKYLGWEYYDGNFPLIIPDYPLTPEDMQNGIGMIMGRFYHSTAWIKFLFNMFSIPHIVLYFHRLKSGWKKWHRKWRNYAFRSFGSQMIKRWFVQFRKGTFLENLQKAKNDLAGIKQEDHQDSETSKDQSTTKPHVPHKS